MSMSYDHLRDRLRLQESSRVVKIKGRTIFLNGKAVGIITGSRDWVYTKSKGHFPSGGFGWMVQHAGKKYDMAPDQPFAYSKSMQREIRAILSDEKRIRQAVGDAKVWSGPWPGGYLTKAEPPKMDASIRLFDDEKEEGMTYDHLRESLGLEEAEREHEWEGAFGATDQLMKHASELKALVSKKDKKAAALKAAKIVMKAADVVAALGFVKPAQGVLKANLKIVNDLRKLPGPMKW